MMVPFSVNLIGLLMGWKTMTTREDAKLHYFRKMKPKKSVVDAHWTNPRNHNPEHFKAGRALVKRVTRKPGSLFTLEDAVDDGFGYFEDPYEAYVAALRNLHGLTHTQVLNHEWTQIRWWNWFELNWPARDHPAFVRNVAPWFENHGWDLCPAHLLEVEA